MYPLAPNLKVDEEKYIYNNGNTIKSYVML